MRTGALVKHGVAAVMVAVVLCVCVGSAGGTSREWTGATSDNWFTTTNWDPNGTPAVSDHLVVLSGSPTSSSWVPISNGGSVTVDGAATVVTLTDGVNCMYVANSGSGWLDILNGADVYCTGRSIIGANSGSSGTATVSGVGSTWTNTGDLYVAQQGDGFLGVADGGMVSNSIGYLGYASTGSGQATVSGVGSQWTNSSSLYVGNTGSGSLSVTEGGRVSNTVGYIGQNSGSSGSAMVSGPGSAWTNSSSLYVGTTGSGSLSVTDGGRVSNTVGYIGYNSGSSGSAMVSGPGSAWTNSGQLNVGDYGTGSLSVAAGAKVSSTSTYVGQDSAASGQVSVSGGGATFTNSGNLYLGPKGEGSMTVTAGGKVSNQNGYLGSQSTGRGQATVSGAGSTWTNSSNVGIGLSGEGLLAVTDGGSVSNSSAVLGENSGGSGQATVSGAGSTWTCSGSELYVGQNGTGTLTVADGATVRTDGDLKVASGSGSTGTVNLEGGTLSADAIAAPVGTDTFNWTGGTLRVTGTGGLSLSTTGLLGTNVSLSPGKALSVTKTTTVNSGVTLDLGGGSFSTKDLTVNGTARLRSGDATIGNTFSVGASGELEINGHDIALAASPTLSGGARLRVISGSLSAPSLAVTSGTVVTLDDAMLSAAMLYNFGGAILGQGIFDATVANEGNIALSGDSSFYGDVSNDCGTNAKIIISGGSAVTFFEDVLNDATGEIRVSSGCTATYFGSVSGTGLFTGTGTSYIEGDMRPGSSPGTTHFEGDVVFGFAASLVAELGESANDLLDVDGLLSLDGTLDVVLYGGFEPEAGDTFDLLDWGSLDGTFHTVKLPTLPGGLDWDTSDLYVTGELTVTPEPATLTLLALGALALLGRRKK